MGKPGNMSWEIGNSPIHALLLFSSEILLLLLCHKIIQDGPIVLEVVIWYGETTAAANLMDIDNDYAARASNYVHIVFLNEVGKFVSAILEDATCGGISSCHLQQQAVYRAPTASQSSAAPRKR